MTHVIVLFLVFILVIKCSYTEYMEVKTERSSPFKCIFSLSSLQ